MPRRARKYNETNFFHIIVQGINKEYIFDKERYIKQYMKLLYKYKVDTSINIIAYCIMNNHAHLLLYTETIDEMSQYMHKVNTGYAKYYNYINKDRVGYVFRDRYVSEPIENQRYLINCINYIHYNPVKGGIVEKCSEYKYSSYNMFINGKNINLLSKLLGEELDVEIFIDGKVTDVFEDLEVDTDEFIRCKINNMLAISNISIEESLKDKVILKLLIKYLKEQYKIKYVDMMKFLNISRGKMDKLKKDAF